MAGKGEPTQQPPRDQDRLDDSSLKGSAKDAEWQAVDRNRQEQLKGGGKGGR